MNETALGFVLASTWGLLGVACSGSAPPVGDEPVRSGEPAGAEQLGAQEPRAPGASAPSQPVGPSVAPAPENEQAAAVDGSVAGSLAVPCDVAEIVSDHCTTCHGLTPQFNAPMPLVSGGDFSAAAPISTGRSVREVALERVTTEGARQMPPPGTVGALDAQELAALTAWLEAGAPSAAEGCDILDAANVPLDVLPEPPEAGASLQPYVGWDEGGVECYRLVANSGDKVTPYAVGTANDTYVGFGFMPPWDGVRYIRSIRTVIDNAEVLHHWLLFQLDDDVDDGSVSRQSGVHPDGQLVHGWAPGGGDLYFTQKVAVRSDPSKGYLLELHYNSSDPSAVDASGAEVCVTSTPPDNEALLSWLGTDRINGTSATGTCRPRSSESIHIIAGTPHMHLKGQHMKVTVNRGDGGQEVVHDEAFSFENQRIYAQQIELLPGDSITTNCTFSSPASFGPGTNQEMCYWFAMAYPAGELADGGFLGTLLHGDTSCLGM